MERAIDGLFVIAALAAAWSDVKTKRIPNPLTFALIAFGVASHLVTGGLISALESLGLAAATIAVGSFVYARGWLAGGDIKLLAAGVAVFAWPAAIDFLLFTGLAGGLLAVAVALRQNRLVRMLSTITWSLIIPGTPVQPSRGYASLPYGVAIAGGALLITLTRCFTGLRLTL